MCDNLIIEKWFVMKREKETLHICAWIFLIFGLVLGAVLLSVGVVYNGGVDEKSKMFASLYFVLGEFQLYLMHCFQCAYL